MGTRNLEAAEHFRQTMLGMLGNEVACMEVSAAHRDSGWNYKIVKGDPPKVNNEGFWIKQGYSSTQGGALTFNFNFMYSKGRLTQDLVDKVTARVFDFECATDSRARRSNAITIKTSPIAESDLSKVESYVRRVCPKVSKELFPGWHRENG